MVNKLHPYPDWSEFIEKQPIQGTDSLGLESVVASIGRSGMLNKLLFGLTNATIRARYFSFMPWVIWRFIKSNLKKTSSEQEKFIRRVEMLFIYRSYQHSLDNQKISHRGLIGSQTAEKIYKNQNKNLTFYSSDKEFTHRTSCFDSQNYRPSLEKMQIIIKSGEIIRLTENPGVLLAKSFDEEIQKDKDYGYLKNLELKDSAHLSAIKKLPTSFCICGIRKKAAIDRLLIIDLLFAERYLKMVDSMYGDNQLHINRAKSLTLFLDILSRTNAPMSEDTILKTIYFGAYPDGQLYNPPQCLINIYKGWQVFELRRHQQYVLETIWYAVLKEIEILRAKNQYVTIDMFIRYFSHRIISHDLFLKIMGSSAINGSTLFDLINATGTYINPQFLSFIKLDSTEAKRCFNFMKNYCTIKSTINEYIIIDNIERSLNQDHIESAVWAIILLATAFLRNIVLVTHDSDPLIQILVNEGSNFGISIMECFKKVIDIGSHTIKEFFEWVVKHWLFTQHYTTAVRRLLTSSNNTFKIKITDNGGIDLVEDFNFDEVWPRIVPSRINSALWLMDDLLLVSAVGRKLFKITNEGKSLKGNLLKNFNT